MAKKKNIKNKPEKVDTKALERKGQTSFDTGNYIDAIGHWNRLLKIRGGINAQINNPLLPKLAKAYFLHSETLTIQAREESLKWACMYAPNESCYITRLLSFYRSQRNLEDAIPFLEELICSYPKILGFKHIHIVLLILQGEQAKKRIDVIIKEFDDDTKARLMSLLYLVEAKRIDPFKHLRQKKQLSSLSKLALLLMCLSSDNKEKPDDEITLFQEEKDQFFTSQAQFYMGIRELENNELEKAKAFLYPSLEFLTQKEILLTPKRRKRFALILSYLGVDEANHGNLEKATQLWRWALKLSSQDEKILSDLAGALSSIATNHAKNGEWDKAIALWEETRDIAPGDLNIQKNLALAYEIGGKINEAIDLWERTAKNLYENLVRAEDPIIVKRNIIFAYRQLAECYQKQNEYEKVAHQYHRILDLSPQDMDIKSKLTENYLSNHKLDEAFTLLDELIEIDPKNSTYLTNMGIAYDLSGKREEAIKWWEEALSSNPRDATAIEMLSYQYEDIAMARWDAGKLEEARDLLNKKLLLKPNDSNTFCLLAGLSMDNKHSDEAEEYLNKAVETSPNDPMVWIRAGEIFLKHGKIKHAQMYLQKAESIADQTHNIPDILSRIGFAYCSIHSPKDRISRDFLSQCLGGSYCQIARDYLDRSIKAGGNSLYMADTLEDLCCSHILHYAQEAVKSNPDIALAHALVGIALFRAGDYGKASETLSKVLSMPDINQDTLLFPFLAKIARWIKYIKEETMGEVKNLESLKFPWQ